MDQERVLEALFKVEAMSADMGEIKVAMKEMAVAVSRLAVMEANQAHDRGHITRLFKLTDDHGERINELEKVQPLQKQTSAWVERAVTAVITAVISGVMSLVIVSNYVPAAKAPVVAAPR